VKRYLELSSMRSVLLVLVLVPFLQDNKTLTSLFVSNNGLGSEQRS
jgi:hypothetical protein